jgi:hypothetical protein
MWTVEMLGSIRREDTTYYAGYSSGMLVEFTLMPDTMPSTVGKIKKAVEQRKAVGIDISCVDKHRAINWKLDSKTYEALQTGEPLVREVRQSKPKSKSRPRQKQPRRKQP